MSPRPTDRELDRLLSELPRAAAPPGFARRVLADLDATPRPHGGRRWLLAVAGAAALAAGLWLLPQAAPRQQTLAESQALEQEHRLLVEELEALKASLRDGVEAPVLYLGGTEGLDVVLDLQPVWHGAAGGARPAAYGDPAQPAAASNRHGGTRR